jgi:hypothetical protein
VGNPQVFGRRGVVLGSLFVLLSLAACDGGRPDDASRAERPILLFDGNGTSRSDIVALETVLRQSGVKYATVGSQQVNAMTASQFQAYRLLKVRPWCGSAALACAITATTLRAFDWSSTTRLRMDFRLNQFHRGLG